MFVAAVLAFRAIASSPFGRTLVAIRQNEARVRYLGLDTDRFIFVALLISATMAGVSGAMFGLLINFAYPLMLDWHQSGDFVLMMILGGAGTVWGSLVGAFIYVIGKDIISTITPLWQIFLGALFVACVLGFPKGILGTIAALAAASRCLPQAGRRPARRAHAAAGRQPCLRPCCSRRPASRRSSAACARSTTSRCRCAKGRSTP